MTDLTAENARLRRMIRELLDRSEANHQIQVHFQKYEFRLLGCDSLGELLSLLTEGLQQHFDLQQVCLLLRDPDHSYRMLAQSCQLPPLPVHFLHEPAVYDQYFGRLRQGVFLGGLSTADRARYFVPADNAPAASRPPPIASSALLPLVHGHGELVGCLAMGSDQRTRFSPDKSTDFLSHLSSIIAVCIDNVCAQEILRRQTQTDMLTHLNNRRYFETELVREVAAAARSGLPLGCLFLDVDYFKKVNDTHGHQTGDRCLQQVAEVIRSQLRRADVLARYGGEEFVCLLPGTTEEKAAQTAERIRQAVEQLVCTGHLQQTFRVTISIGFCVWQWTQTGCEPPADVASNLVACADSAMYEAKRGGRNRVCSRPFCVAGSVTTT